MLRDTITSDKLKAAGLGDIFRDRMSNNDLAGNGRNAISYVMHGPDGVAGVLLQPLAAEPQESDGVGLGYYPDRQQWVKVEVGGKVGYYIGYDPSNLPGPQDLERDKMISGYMEQLGGGQEWEAPVIRLKDSKTNLPDIWKLKSGRVVASVRNDWQWAWDLSGEIWEWFTAEDSVNEELAFVWCAKLLGINYRVGAEEVSILGLLGKDFFSPILRAAVNGPLIEMVLDEQKKRQTADSDSTSDSLNSTVGQNN